MRNSGGSVQIEFSRLYKIRFPRLPGSGPDRRDVPIPISCRKKRRWVSLERDRVFTATRLDSSRCAPPPAFLNQQNGEGAAASRGEGDAGAGVHLMRALLIDARACISPIPQIRGPAVYFRRPTVISCAIRITHIHTQSHTHTRSWPTEGRRVVDKIIVAQLMDP